MMRDKMSVWKCYYRSYGVMLAVNLLNFVVIILISLIQDETANNICLLLNKDKIESARTEDELPPLDECETQMT